MKREIKIVIIGAGSTYTPELIEGIIGHRENLNIGEIALMDIDAEKLNIVGNMAKRMVKNNELDWRVSFHTDYECISGADYVLTQIRVGKLAARINDEKIPLKYGLIGQETCGIGGFFKALRTIPVLQKIADKMEQLAPKAVMINFTNPSGIVTQALSGRKTLSIGLCNGPYAMEKSVRDALGLQKPDIQYVGLNHFAWLTSIKEGDKDYLDFALKSGINSEAMKNIPANGFSKELLQVIGGIPSTYLEYYYFRLDKLKFLQQEKLSRGEVCQNLERDLLIKYTDENLVIKPPELEKRGGAFYSKVAVNLLEAIENDRKTRHIINLKNNGALEFMNDDDIIEGAALVGRDSIEPIPVKDFKNRHVISMMKIMKEYEHMAVIAAKTGKKSDAINALMLNPLCGDYNAVKGCYDELYQLNKQYLQDN